MEFIDHTGHVFSLPSYNIEPIGYEYETLPYIFWVDNEYTFNLSVNNYYIKPIRIFYNTNDSLVDIDDISITITSNSSIFKLVGSATIQDKLENNDTLFRNITIDENTDIKTVLTNTDLNILKIEEPDKYTYTKTTYYYTDYTLTQGREIYTGEVKCISNNGTYMYVGTIKNLLTGLKETEVELEREDTEYVYKKISNDDNETSIEIDGETYELTKKTSNYLFITFYIICLCENEGTFHTNILININNTEYCPISIGGTFVDECEQLIINGKNYGINLPKDILKAVYQNGFYNYEANDALYNEKIKELLLNYMPIKGECGNFNSAISALKWFGWGNKISIYKLLKTDNEFMNQYILDDFDITNDILNSFKLFRNSTYISLQVKENIEGEQEEYNFNNDFWGENKPIMKNLFNQMTEVKYDECDITFYKPYYDFMFNELALKISYLKYCYEKYFLPIHLSVHSASITHQVHINDIKLITEPFVRLSESPIINIDKNINVVFPNTNIQYFNRYNCFIDDNFNQFSKYYELGKTDNIDIFEIDDTCVQIPIHFISKISYEIYNCVLLLYKILDNDEKQKVYESHFSFTQSDNIYENFIIYPKMLNKDFNINFWENKNFVIYLLVNGKWFYYFFTLKVAELRIEFGTLEYKYYLNNISNLHRQLTSTTVFNQDSSEDGVRFNSFMWQPDLALVNNSNFINEIQTYSDKLSEYITKYINTINISNTKKYYNRCHIFDLKINDGDNNYINVNVSDDISNLVTNNKFVESVYTVFNKLYNFNNYNLCEDNGIYKSFFNISNNDEITYKYNNIRIINNDLYDYYIMHDFNVWYIVFISVNTEDKLNDIEYHTKHENIILDNGYCLQYRYSDDKFLINRMQYIKKENGNHFKSDDIVVCSLVNNDRMPFKLILSAKWKFKPLSIGMSSTSEVESKSEMGIISIGNENIKYEKGYYDVICRYSIDNYIQHQYITRAKIRID